MFLRVLFSCLVRGVLHAWFGCWLLFFGLIIVAFCVECVWVVGLFVVC